MLKTLQIIRSMIVSGYSKEDILLELQEIVDNEYSEKFELSENDIVLIQKVFNDDSKLEMAFNAAHI